MDQPDFERLYAAAVADNAQQRAEIARLTQLLEDLQKNLQASLEGSTELRQQLKDLQEKLDTLIAKKKNRDRKDFGSKREGHNPRPAQTSTDSKRRNRNDSTQTDETPEPQPEANPETVDHPVSEEDRICPNCNVETVFVGHTVTHQLESLLQSLKWVDHRQEVRACKKCKTYIKTAQKPTSPIPGSYAGPTLLAKIVVSKVDDGLPNHRQQKIFRREAFPIARSTQCDWSIAMSLTVEPLYDLLNSEILASAIIQTDETQIKIQDRKVKENIRKGKFFVCRGDSKHPLVSFTYSPDLTFALNKAFFRGFNGIIQADAAVGFDALFRDGNATEAGCNAHARRKVYDAKETVPDVANRMLDIYDELYKIERKARKLPPEGRLALRRRYSKNLMKELRKMHTQNQRTYSPSHLLHEAASYALNHWRALTRFLKNPHIEIDNNASEREIKHLVIARKNFLFCGSDAGAKAVAIHSSLVASARRNGLNPVEYLADVFARINDMKTSELHQLLPDRWKQHR